MKPLNQKQQFFLAALAVGVSLPDALAAQHLKWGTIAAWRRWNPSFRNAHNQALKVGIPKRRLLRRIMRAQELYGPEFRLSSCMATLVENARASMGARTGGPAGARVKDTQP